MDESQITCDNYRCHEYGSKMQRNVYYEDDDEMEYFLCNKCHKSTTPQVVEIKMGDCYMCDKPAVFIAHDLPTGEKPFCSELHFCQYARLSYHGEGYYGFTDPTKVKEPARLARARKRLKYAETFEARGGKRKWKVGDKVRIIGNSGGYHDFDIGEIVTLVIEYPTHNGWWEMVNDGIPIKEQLVSLKDVELVEEERYIPKYKVGDILIDRGTREKAIIVDYTSAKGEYHWKYLEGSISNIFLDTPFEELDTDIDYELYVPPNTNPRKARLKERFGFGAESFSAEKVKKEILEDDDDRLVMKFIYKDREGKLEWSDNEDGKGGVLSFGDNPFKKGERMSRLPHTQIIDSATSKLAAKEMFRLSLDRKCHTCKEPIYKKDIGSCGWCEDEMGPSKFDDTYFYEDDWFKRLSPTTQDGYIHDLANKNPYCRDCLYYYGLGKNYPSAFDKESANYYLANAVCEKHWDEIVAEGGLSKDTKRNSLYEIENVSPRERMMKQRFGFGAEAFSSENGDKQLELAVKRTKMSMIRTGLAITTFTIVMWNLWTNKKQEKDISEIMDMI